MSKLNRIINWFPRPESLTEVSILSAYEILAYLVCFFFCLWIYKSWTTIPVKEIDINCDRIDTLQIYTNIEYQDPKTGENKSFLALAKTEGIINIFIPNKVRLGTTIYDDNHISTLFNLETRHPIYKDSIKYETNYYKEREENKALFDSLYHKYYKEHLISYNKKYHFNSDTVTNLKTTPAFLCNISMKNNATRLYHHVDEHSDIIFEKNGVYPKDTLSYYLKMSYTNNYKHFHIGEGKTDYQFYLPENVSPNIKEFGGIFDKPRWYDNFDISQCYYKFIIKTKTIDTINLNLHFMGANEFIYVNGIPNLHEAQLLKYQINALDPLHKDNDDLIVLHVKSKEFENTQNYRIFFITAILSGLVVIFLTFLIIFFYRLVRYQRAKLKSRREQTIISEKTYKNITSDIESGEIPLEVVSSDEMYVTKKIDETISSENMSEKENEDIEDPSIDDNKTK